MGSSLHMISELIVKTNKTPTPITQSQLLLTTNLKLVIVKEALFRVFGGEALRLIETIKVKL